MPHLFSTAVLALAVPIAAQTITLAEGTPASMSIVTLPENNPNAPDTIVLQDIELLPIEITGRVLGQASDTSRSRRLARNSMVRIELPNHGRLFRYRRAGGAHWGFLHIAADGTPRAVLERPGIAGADPFEDRVGVARNGSHFAVPLLAGGLFIVRLDGNLYASTGTAHRLVAATTTIESMSVMVGDQVVWFQSEALEVFRCGLADSATPIDVSPTPQANADLKAQMAMSDDGSCIVYLYGPQLLQQFWMVDLTSAATLLPPTPSKYEDPGYLPEGPGSAALLLNEDGSRLFYIDSDVRDELYLLDMTGGLATLHITDDPIFQPYIGVHVLPGFLAGALTVAIGDPNQMDWFRAQLTAGGGTVSNLTATGSNTQPYPAGTVDPQNVVKNVGVHYTIEQAANGLTVRRINLATGNQVLLQDQVTAMPFRGSGVGMQADLVIPTAQGDRLYTSTGSMPLFALPFGLTLAPPVTGPAFSAVWVELANGWGTSAFYLANGTFVTGPFEFGMQQLCLSAVGGVVAIGSPVRYLAPGVFVVMNRPAVAWRRCLSGAGV